MTVHEQAAAFVLDALDSEEAREFEQHLRHCPDCEEQLEPLRVAATALAFAGELPRPRPELRRRVLATDPIVLPFRGRWSPPLLSAVALAACAALVLGLNRQGQAPGVSLVLGENGHVMLVAQGLPSPPPGKVYEIWITQGDQATPAGFLRGRRAELTRPVLPGTRVAVTVEPSGGSRRPTGPLLLETETA